VAESSENSAAVKRYEQNKRSLVRELQRCLDLRQPGETTTRDMAAAVNNACQRYGYKSGATASIFGKRDLVKEERQNLVLTPTKAGYFACVFTDLDIDPWADTPKQALYQVYCWCLFGAASPPPNAEPDYLRRLNALPNQIQLELIRPVELEPAEQRAEICAQLRAATPEAAAQYLEALAENMRGHAYQPADEDDEEPELPCNERCTLVSYLRLGSKVGLEITDDDRDAIAEATGIPLPRMTRLLCGDPWTASEAAVLDEYVDAPGFTLEGLAAIAEGRANVDHQPIPRG
jgi:hypothetical protein